MFSVTKPTSLRGTQECVRRECPVTTIHGETECIVQHGEDRFAASYDRIAEAMLAYDRWVDFLHVRDDVQTAWQTE